MTTERAHMDCYSGGEECLLNQADCPMKPCPECGSHLKQQKMYAVICGNCQLVLENQTPIRFSMNLPDEATCPTCGQPGLHQQDEWGICLVGETVINEETDPDDKRVYMGLQIIVDITGKDQEEIWKALETVLCGSCDTGENDCTIESMASCTLTDDLQGIFTWMNGEELDVQQAQTDATHEGTSDTN